MSLQHRTLCSSFIFLVLNVASKQHVTHEADTQRTFTVPPISLESNSALAGIASKDVFTQSIPVTTVQI